MFREMCKVIREIKGSSQAHAPVKTVSIQSGSNGKDPYGDTYGLYNRYIHLLLSQNAASEIPAPCGHFLDLPILSYG